MTAPLGLVDFHKSLRLQDNAALSAALSECEQVICTLTWRLDGSNERLVASDWQAALELDRELAAMGSGLVIAQSEPRQLARQLGATKIYANRDYEFSISGQEVSVHTDRFVFDAEDIVKEDGSPYTVYTPFMKAWWRYLEDRGEARSLAEKPVTLSAGRLLPRQELPASMPAPEGAEGWLPLVPGATAARERLREFVKEPIYRYGKERDYPACDATSMLSAYLRNGTLSIRECFRAAMPLLPDPNVLKWLNELIWREFYGAISTHFPRVHEQAFRQEYENLPWRYSEEDLGKWKSGNTGFPIVDAAMRQLSEEGLMHNRLRMVVASFLTKDLRISWQEGERHFEANLLDLEPSSNNGGWQWAGSTGTDAAPYFRIFNPWRQSQRFDPQGTYIKRWLPPLRDLDPSSLHEPRAARPGFPEPMVDHRDARELALAMYKQATAG